MKSARTVQEQISDLKLQECLIPRKKIDYFKNNEIRLIDI